jgi:geranyl-CoA carboxylase alpha subunit
VASFEKLLIANRGEIAVRIARTARALGLRTVAVYSKTDRGAPHVSACDEAVALGGEGAAESYLSIPALLGAAERSGADAVHPGYGFLAENGDFAAACEAAGLTFVGPSVAAIRLMGNKALAKARMLEIGVPCIPGYQGAQDDVAFGRAARDIGFPVMLKAAAGGGGKGMRLVASPDALQAALEPARSEALQAFGSPELLLERALVSPRHIEVQIFGDRLGTIVHLGERDCSIQRRHQKIVEEAPSPAVDPGLRERLGSAAVEAARAVSYVGAGTIEFLLDTDGTFYFMEMNTRLQVEHAVTEAVTGIDLVAWQLRVAAGEPLPLDEPRGAVAGHAIEARLYAEDPAHGFLPQAGRIVRWVAPGGDGIRVDHALASGLDISPYYDPMLAKIVGAGANREEARRRLIVALGDTYLFGVVTNRRFLIDCLEYEAFVRGDARTDFVAVHFAEPLVAKRDAALLRLCAVLAYTRDAERAGEIGWRSSGIANAVLRLRTRDEIVTIALSSNATHRYDVVIEGESRSVSIVACEDGRVRFSEGGVESTATYGWDGDTLFVQSSGDDVVATDVTFAPPAASVASAERTATAPMPGIVSKVLVSVGDDVEKGQPLVFLEAMKMVHEIVAATAGRVASVLVSAGQQVGMRASLIEIEASEARP